MRRPAVQPEKPACECGCGCVPVTRLLSVRGGRPPSENPGSGATHSHTHPHKGGAGAYSPNGNVSGIPSSSPRCASPMGVTASLRSNQIHSSNWRGSDAVK
jgi:hypothetical protein